MLWTNEYLDRIALEAETEIAAETSSIIDRLSIEVFEGTYNYQLPEYVINIRKVLWRGNRLDPMAQMDYDNWVYTLASIQNGAFDPRAYSKAFNIGTEVKSGGTPKGKPMRYFYSTFGENVLVFNPGVHESIEFNSGDLYGSAIADSVIVEFYRSPDASHKIPNYIRRRTIKAYVLWKSFQKEGDGQNLQAAEYHKSRYFMALAKAKSIINHVYSAAVSTRKPYGYCGYNNCENDYGYQGPYRKARPVLPSNYGIVVDDCCD